MKTKDMTYTAYVEWIAVRKDGKPTIRSKAIQGIVAKSIEEASSKALALFNSESQPSISSIWYNYLSIRETK
jgi:hypothetical protein